MNAVGFPSCRIIANNSFFLADQYQTEFGIDRRKAKLDSMQL